MSGLELGGYKKLIAIIVALTIIVSTVSAVLTISGIKYITEAEEAPLYVKISANKNSGVAPLVINFSSLVLHYEGDLNYHWDFGDGNTSEEINPTNTYKEDGNYICNLTVKDSTGEKDSDGIEISVETRVVEQPGIEINRVESERPMIWFLSTLMFSEILKKIYPGNPKERLIDHMIGTQFESIFFSEVEGWVTCTAAVTNPENVVSYKWTLLPPAYTERVLKGGRTKYPEYYFEGENVTFPPVYTYRSGTYRVILEVEDHEGNVRSNTEAFKINWNSEKTSLQEKIRKVRGSIGSIVDNWKTKWSKKPGSPGYNLVAGSIGFILRLSKKHPGTAVILLTILKTKFDVGALDVWDKIPEKMTEFYDSHPIARDKIKSIFDSLEYKLEVWGLDDLKNALQLNEEKFGLDNKRPVILNPFPEDEDKNIDRDCPYVSINVTDPEGDRFNITISGEYVNERFYDNVTSGIFNATLINPLPPVTEIKWHVKVVDLNGKVVEKDYRFKTFA